MGIEKGGESTKRWDVFFLLKSRRSKRASPSLRPGRRRRLVVGVAVVRVEGGVDGAGVAAKLEEAGGFFLGGEALAVGKRGW